MTNTQSRRLANLEEQACRLEQDQSRIQKCIVNGTAYTSPTLKRIYQSIYERQAAQLVKIKELHRKLLNKVW